MKNIYCLLMAFFFILPLGFAQFERVLPGFYDQSVYCKRDGKIYALGYDPKQSPSSYLAVIDPLTAVADKRVGLNGNNLALCLSSDELYLYLGSDSIQRYNLVTRQFDQKFDSQIEGSEKYTCNKIVSIPDDPSRVVVFWGGISREYVATYVAGLRQGVITAPYRGRDVITAGKNLFLLGGDFHFPTLFQISAAPTLSVLPNQYNYLFGPSRFLRHYNGRIYGSDGVVIEIVTSEKLTQIGRLNTQSTQLTIVPYAPGSDTLYAQVIRRNQVWLQKYDRNNFQLLKEELLCTFNKEQDITEVIPLGNPYAFLAIAAANFYLVHRCVSTIKTLPDFTDNVQYGCFRDTLSIIAPGSFPENNYFWSDGFRGKTYAYPVRYQENVKLSYRVADAQGCLSLPSPELEIRYVYQAGGPHRIDAKNGTSALCNGGFVELKVIEDDPRNQRFQQYLWSDGQTGHTIKVSKPGAYTCQIRSREGCWSAPTRDPFLVRKVESPHPAKPILKIEGGDGDTIVCSVDTAKIVAPPGFSLYRWSDGVQTTSNERALPLEVEYLSVEVKNEAGCLSEVSDRVDWTYFTTPSRPTVQRAGSLLASSAHQGNQWYLNGVPIPGANTQFFTPQKSGTYTVQVINPAGCSSLLSALFEFN